MNTYIVSYDLQSPGRDYAKLHDAIRAYPTWAKPLESVWFIQSNAKAGAVRDHLGAYMDSNDKLLVIEVSRNWGTRMISKKVTDWMNSHIGAYARI